MCVRLPAKTSRSIDLSAVTAPSLRTAAAKAAAHLGGVFRSYSRARLERVVTAQSTRRHLSGVVPRVVRSRLFTLVV
jgi:hypothetical protein